jgi:hypothetical protein
LCPVRQAVWWTCRTISTRAVSDRCRLGRELPDILTRLAPLNQRQCRPARQRFGVRWVRGGGHTPLSLRPSAGQPKRWQPRSPPATALQNLSAIRTVQGQGRFMESPLFLSDLLTDHEPLRPSRLCGEAGLGSTAEARKTQRSEPRFIGSNIIIQIQRRPGWKDSINASRERLAFRDERQHL